VAFLWRGALGPARAAWIAGAKNAAVWAASVALVTALEYAQAWFPPRSVALQDVIAASVGAAIGLAAWRLSARRLLFHMARWSGVRGREGVAGWLVWPYVAFLVLYNVMPLDLTSSPYVVYEKWQRHMIHVVPFESLGGSPWTRRTRSSSSRSCGCRSRGSGRSPGAAAASWRGA